MPAKKRGAEKAAAGKAKSAKGLPVSEEQDVPRQPAAVTGNASSAALAVNGEVIAKHLQNVKLFSEAAGDVFGMDPRRQDMLQPFDEKSALAALAAEGRYYCATNLGWLDHAWSPCPQVPLSAGAVDKISDFFFEKPASFGKQRLVVAVLQAEVDGKRFPTPGMWKRISPEESVIAFYQQAAKAAQRAGDGSKEGEQEVTEWLNFLLAAPCEVIVVPNEARYEWEAQQYREDIMQMTYLQRTPSQRIFDAVSKIDMMGSNYSPQALVNLYTENLKMSCKSENFTVNFLVCSQVVYERALNVPDLLQIIMLLRLPGKTSCAGSFQLWQIQKNLAT